MSKLTYDDRVAVVPDGCGLGRAYALLLGQGGAKWSATTLAARGLAKAWTAALPKRWLARSSRPATYVETLVTAAGDTGIIAAPLDRWGRLYVLVHSAGNAGRQACARRRSRTWTRCSTSVCAVALVDLMSGSTVGGRVHVTS